MVRVRVSVKVRVSVSVTGFSIRVSGMFMVSFYVYCLANK